MGSSKQRVQNSVENRITQGQSLEDQRAQEMQDQLQATRSTAQANVAATDPTLTGAIGTNLTTGGYNPDVVSDINSQYKAAGALGAQTANTGSNLIDPTKLGNAVTASSYGRGRETYQNMADTGGYTPEQSNAFLRNASNAATAGYSADKDILARRLAIQGGYMPGFSSSQAKMARDRAAASSNAELAAQTNLNEQINSNRLAGAGGLAATRTAAGQEALGANQQAINAALGGARTGIAGAQGQAELETGQARGRSQAVQDLARYYQSNVNQMSDADKLQIQNRLAQLGMTQTDINGLLGIGAQKRGPFGMGIDLINAGANAARAASGFSGGNP